MTGRLYLIAVLIFASAVHGGEKSCQGPIWTVDLVAKYHFRPFELVKHARNQPPLFWMTQRGVAFTSPGTLAVYQVQESDGWSNVQARDLSGGGGKYALQIVFLDAQSGKGVYGLRLTTSSTGESRVYATHDGRFLVETGLLLRLFSPSFQEITSRTLPSATVGMREAWSISVIPPGRRIYIATVDINQRQLLNADTLETVSNPKPSDVAWWAKGNDLFPESRGPGQGVFTSDGHWLRLNLESKARGDVLATFADVPTEVPGAVGCKELRVFSSDGLTTWNVRTRDEIASYISNGKLLAAGMYHHRADPLDLGWGDKPISITVYDLGARSERCTIRIAEPASYDLSSAGNVAVALGNLLSVYQP